MALCNDQTRPSLEEVLKRCLRVLRSYQWLLDAYVVDFFVEEHFKRIPQHWQPFLRSLTPTQLATWLEPSQPFKSSHLPPLELLALRATLGQLSLSRNLQDNRRILQGFLGLDKAQTDTKGDWQSFEDQFDLSKNGLHEKTLKHVFRKHVKPKKQHEIARMAELIQMLAQATMCQKVIDIGSGVGHLSRLLGCQYGFDVVCVDSQEDFTNSAKKFDADLSKCAQKYFSNTEALQTVMNPPKHLTFTLKADTVPSDLEVQLVEKFDHHESAKVLNYGIVGLHTCGDLGPLLINLFAESDTASFLVSVGCCYMRLKDLYPLSRFLKQQEWYHFSYFALELACHAMEVYRERLESEDRKKLRIHCYRALLESLISKKYPDLRHTGLRTVAKGHELSFAEYVRQATSKFSEVTWQDEELCEEEEVKTRLRDWWLVVVFYSLRISFAPVIETVLLLDRMIFLLEHRLQSILLPLFEPKLSPRNHVLIAFRKAKHK